MKKKYKINILLLVLLLVITACEEEKAFTFSGARGINFIAVDGPANGKDTYTLLDRSIDMVPHYVKGQFGFGYDTLKVLVRLEGTVSDKPLKVKVKALPVEGYPTPEFIIPERMIEPGLLLDTITIYTKELTQYEIDYKAKIVFDYENSDVVAGVKERQQFTLTVYDKFPLKANMYVDNGDAWNNKYSSLLGNYGEKKIRLLWSVVKGVKNIFYYYTSNSTKYEYMITEKIPAFKAALKAYNDLHKDNPLREKDGSLVTFD